MGTLVAIDVGAELSDRLRQIPGLSIEEGSSQEIGRFGKDVELVVVGETVGDPVRTAQRVWSAAPQASVVILSTAERLPAVGGAVRFAPLIGDDVVCVASEDAEQVVELIRGTLQRVRRASAHEATVRALDARMAEDRRESRAHPPAFVDRLLDHAPMGVVALDARRRVTAWNVKAVELFGPAERDVVGRPFLEVLGVDPQGPWAEVANVPTSEAHTSVLPYPAAGGRHLEVVVTGWEGEGGSATLLLVQDVSTRVRLAEELASALQAAHQANRRKDEFLAMLGHELRNPLAPIVTGLRLMRLREPRSATDRERGIIERQVRHLIGLVDDLLDISRVTRGKLHLVLERMEISAAVGRALEMVDPLMKERRHQLTNDVPDVGLEVFGDLGRLAQVFANLLTNAAKYTEPGGRIRLVAEASAGEVAVRVRDTGSGIAPAEMAEVFEPFVQHPQALDRHQGGLGIGLAIVRSLVELHGGRVDLTSEVGVGSEFVVRLPRVHDDRPIRPSTDTPSRVAALPPIDVLVVDDNQDAAALLAEELRIAGCRVEVAYDGANALLLAERRRFDAAVLDIGLPGMDGYTLARRLRARPGGAELHLVAVTGYGQEEDKRAARAAGFDHHLVKPVAFEELVRVLEERVRSTRLHDT